jgi:hypothetical protein
MDELWSRLRVTARQAARVPAGEPGSSEWLATLGRTWREARQRQGLSSAQAADQLGVHTHQVAFLEAGLISRAELRQRLSLEGLRFGRASLSATWLLRQLLIIALAHALVLATCYFLLLLGDALFTSYAIVLRDAVFVSYVAQLGWLQRMAAEFKAAIAFVVSVSALAQMVLLTWRAVTE